MARIRIHTLGGFAVLHDDEVVKLPGSRRTRALLAYLALTGRPQRRERLCELFWDVPDDPRGALRWSLSKIRPLVNDKTTERLTADRERVALRVSDLEVDLRVIAEELDQVDLTANRLEAVAAALGEPLLDGMPSATAEELDWFNQFQRATTSPRNAVRFLSAFGDIDVRHLLSRVRVPTLVLHSLNDQRIPVATGRDLAAGIPGAEFLGLESDGHLLLGREPASRVFVEAVREFLARP